MPIAYSCPHCGKQFSVSEQYAGQSGPCAGCGKTIAIPLAAGMPVAASPPARGGSGTAIIITLLAVFLVGGCCLVAIVPALLLPAIQSARDVARRTQSQNNMKQILLAIHMYESTHRSFPPAVVTDANGKPLYSGRVLLLPYLEQASLYEQFDKTQSWDSPANSALSQAKLSVFTDPSADNSPPGQTDYLFVTGAQTIFEGARATKFREITDGTSNTIVLVEVKGSGINWAEPRDLDISQAMALPPGNRSGGNNVGLADGAVRFISKDATPQTIRELATKDGGEAIGEF